MTPDTTPAPMTHEGALGLLAELVIYGEVRYYCGEEVAALRAYIEAERTRADEAQTRADALQKALDDYRVGAQRNTARIAELEAGVGRLAEMLRQVYGMAGQGCGAPMAGYRWCERIDEVLHHGGPLDEYAEYAADLPPALRSLIGHKEG